MSASFQGDFYALCLVHPFVRNSACRYDYWVNGSNIMNIAPDTGYIEVHDIPERDVKI
jgi:hypothetical protein